MIIEGDCLEVMKAMADNSVSCIVTDPPYGIDFLGKAWDANVGALETYQECLRVLKPGGHILAFSAARTYHHLAITLEQAGFEIRDQIMWIYSSGFPKSQDVGRQLHKKTNGKPDKQRYSKDEMTKDGDNYRHNTNKKLYRILPDINGDRLEKSHEGEGYGYIFEEIITIDNAWSGWGTALKPAHEPICLARKPIKTSIRENCLKYGVGALNIDATRIERDQEEARFPANVIGEIAEPYQKYFYCPKVSRRERHIGYDLNDVPTNEFNDPGKVKDHPLWDESIGSSVSRLQDKIRKMNPVGNNHPTVKPIELMKYLIKLITPKGGRVLDPFNGSGSTGCAAVELGYEYVGIELDPKYVDIACRRIAAWIAEHNPTTYNELFE